VRVSRERFKRELNGGATERAIGLLRRTIADFHELDRELRAAETRAGLDVSADLGLVDRLARLGYSERACTRVADMLAALNDIKNGRPISRRARAILSEREAARQSADRQLAAILAERLRRP
jgi:hypothetical protein